MPQSYPHAQSIRTRVRAESYTSPSLPVFALSFLPLCGTQHLVHLLTCLRLGRDDENWDTHLQHTHGKPRVTPVVHAFHDVQLASVVGPGECCTCIL